MLCPKCNKEILDNETFCNYCGKEIAKKESNKLFFVVIAIVIVLVMSVAVFLDTVVLITEPLIFHLLKLCAT